MGRVRGPWWRGCCLIEASWWRAFVRVQDDRAEQLRQLGAEVVAGDAREIADVECRRSAGNNRAASTATASSFLNNDAPLQGPGQGWSAPAE